MKTVFTSASRYRGALFATAGVAAIAFAGPAYAQDTGASDAVDCPDLNDDGVCDDESTLSDADQGVGESNVITVTGSRIRRDEFSTIDPLTVITADEITQGGFNSSSDALQSTAVTAGSGQINNYFGGFVTDGGTGANTLGLRNLGPARTLILLNGRRLAPGGTRGSVLAADLNVLPTSIVERIEILKAGASSIYGSDAVAGVVNIITDDNFRGLQLEGQYGIPEIGAGADYRVAGTFGFEADRLNIIGSIEYRKREGIERRQQPWTRCPVGGFLNGEGSEFGSADTVGFARGDTCFTLDNGGVTINTIGVSTRPGTSRVDGTVANFNRFVPAPGNTTGPTPGYLGVDFYSRDSFDPENEREFLVTPVETITGFLSTSYELDTLGNAELYLEALATRRQSESPLYRQLALDYPVYVDPNTFAPTGRVNPLVPAQFQNSILAFPNETTGDGFLGVRAFIGYGLTDSSQKVDFVRIGGGIRGDLPITDWRYNFYAGKSWNDGTYEIESFLTDRIAASTDVEVVNGQVVCASRAINPNCVAAPPLNAATVGGDLPQAYRDYIVQNTVGTTKFRETTYLANFDGPIFRLPGGDAQVAVGFEYREQSIDDTPDQNSIDGNLLGLTAAVPTRGTDAVREAFAEIYLPILSGVPFFENLILNGSVRYTDYDSYGSDTTYKIAGEWEFFRGVGVRASYGTSYRAPALAEQFLGATSGFLGSGSDPCDDLPAPANQSPQQQIIAANCASIGIPVGFQQTSGITVLRVGGAQAGLAAETSENLSVGAVIRPPLPSSIGDLSFAVDYFDIEVSNGVADLAGGTILNRCYGDPNFDPNGGFCRFVDRDANNILTVTSSFVNLSTDIVRGLEFNARFATDVFGGRLTLNAGLTRYLEQSTRLFEDEFLDDANGIVTQPDWVGTFDATYRKGPFTVRYGLEYLDGDEDDTTYRFFAFDNQTGTVDEAAVQSFKDQFFLESEDYFLHNLSVQWNVEDNFQLTFAVRNLLDTSPPEITAVGFTGIANAPLYSGYDYIGRRFSVNATFGF